MRPSGLLFFFWLVVFSAVSLGQNKPNTPVVPSTCPVTKPAEALFVPPAPHSSKLPREEFWFGNDRLWTALPAAGMWDGLPHYTPDDPTFSQKLFLWRQGYDPRTEPLPKVPVKGKRLDAAAAPLQSDDHANGGWTADDQFIVTGINFPTPGCWEITANYQNDGLTFVVWVAP
jgi:hypothetical protein